MASVRENQHKIGLRDLKSLSRYVLIAALHAGEKRNWLRMDWTFHESQIRFDIRAEREEYARQFQHPARVLQDRLARCAGGDRTRKPAIPEWKKAICKKRNSEGCCFKQEYSAGAKRRDIITRANRLTLSGELAGKVVAALRTNLRGWKPH
jgi:hypothetical protein